MKIFISLILLTCSVAYAAPPWVEPIDVVVTNDETSAVPVEIINPTEPFFVEDIGPPGRFQEEALMVIDQGTVGRSKAIFDVPEGMLAIVKFVSGRTFTDVDSWVSCEVVRMENNTPHGFGGSHNVIVQKRFRQPRFAGQEGDYSHEFSQGIEFYVDGGLQAGFTCIMIPAPTESNGSIVSLGMTGILVNDNEVD